MVAALLKYRSIEFVRFKHAERKIGAAVEFGAQSNMLQGYVSGHLYLTPDLLLSLP